MPKNNVTLAMLTEGPEARVFRRHITLPFVPQIGMDLQLSKDDIDSFHIDQLSYDLKEGYFLAITNFTMHEEDIEDELKLGWVEQLQPRGRKKK